MVFRANMYLGGPPVMLGGTNCLMPVFNSCQTFIGNYGVIILLVVFILKCCLGPVTYSCTWAWLRCVAKPATGCDKRKKWHQRDAGTQDPMKLYQQAGVNPWHVVFPY